MVKIITPWIGNIGQISAKLDQKCRFSNTANFFGQSQILGIPLYLLHLSKRGKRVVKKVQKSVFVSSYKMTLSPSNIFLAWAIFMPLCSITYTLAQTNVVTVMKFTMKFHDRHHTNRISKVVHPSF